ncbi:unnamed protein product, partial [Schistosoma haematobium]
MEINQSITIQSQFVCSNANLLDDVLYIVVFCVLPNGSAHFDLGPKSMKTTQTECCDILLFTHSN